MRKKLIPALIASLLIVGGALILISAKKDTKSANDSSSEQTKNLTDSFNAVSTNGLSFEATIVSQADGKTISSTMESDAKTGAVRYSADINDAPVTMIYTKDAYYLCQKEVTNCLKYPLGQGTGASFNPSSYQYDETKLADYKTKSVRVGRQSCPSGTCDVWEVSVDKDNKAKVFIDVNTNRVSQVVGGAEGASVTITYTYKDVDVQVPTNVQSIPTTLGQ